MLIISASYQQRDGEQQCTKGKDRVAWGKLTRVTQSISAPASCMLSDWKYFYQEPFDRKFFKNHQQSATDINSLEQYLWICNLFFMYGNIYLNIQKSIQGKVSVGSSILIDFSIKRKTTFFGPDVPSVASFLVFRNGIRFYNWRISVLNRRVCVFKFKIFKRFSPLLHGLCFRALVDQLQSLGNWW